MKKMFIIFTIFAFCLSFSPVMAEDLYLHVWKIESSWSKILVEGVIGPEETLSIGPDFNVIGGPFIYRLERVEIEKVIVPKHDDFLDRESIIKWRIKKK